MPNIIANILPTVGSIAAFPGRVLGGALDLGGTVIGKTGELLYKTPVISSPIAVGGTAYGAYEANKLFNTGSAPDGNESAPTTAPALQLSPEELQYVEYQRQRRALALEYAQQKQMQRALALQQAREQQQPLS